MNKFLVGLHTEDDGIDDLMAFVEITPELLKQINVARKHLKSMMTENCLKYGCKITLPFLMDVSEVTEGFWKVFSENIPVQEFPKVILNEDNFVECEEIIVDTDLIEDYVEFEIVCYGRHTGARYWGQVFIRAKEIS